MKQPDDRRPRMFDDERRHPWIYGCLYVGALLLTMGGSYAKARGWL